jgi:hypothetical protein
MTYAKALEHAAALNQIKGGLDGVEFLQQILYTLLLG